MFGVEMFSSKEPSLLTFLQLALTGVVCKIKIKNQGRMNNHLKKEIVTEKNYEEKRKRKPRRNTKRDAERIEDFMNTSNTLLYGFLLG